MKHRWLYPKNWAEMAQECKERAGWRCEHCGREHGVLVESNRTGNLYRAWLHAAHLDHDPWNVHPRLAALCPSCHGRYDWQDYERKCWLELEILRHRLWVQSYMYAEYGQEA
jgi:hypothetical protein